MSEQVIVRNSARCLSCGDEVESRHRHDCVHCSCGAVMVDGGTSYLRRGGVPEHFEDTSVFADDEPREHELEHSGTVLRNVHHSARCAGRPCTIHNRSDHPLRGFPQESNDWYRVITRTCGHGMEHIDPDEISSLACFTGCDRCCGRTR